MSQPHTRHDHGLTGGIPRWVKIFGIVAHVFVLLFVILHLADRDHHGPRRHILPIEHSMQQP